MLRRLRISHAFRKKIFAEATRKVTVGVNIMLDKSSSIPALEYPGIREDLLRIFHQITATPYQDWLNQESLPRTDSNRLSALLQLIYISTSLAENPCFSIGLFLNNYDEARLLQAVFRAVEQVFQVAGVDATCDRYITCSQWSNLVRAIKRALQIM